MLYKGESMKGRTDEKYSLGSQHTVTRNFIHGRGGPSSVGRAREKERQI